MNTINWSSLAIAVAITLNSAWVLPARAAEEQAPQKHLVAGQFLMEHAKQKLGLTEEQSARIREIVKADREKLVSLLSQSHEARAGLRQAIRAPGANETSVRAAAAKVAAVEADFAVERLTLFGKITPLLTAEQHEKLAQFQTRIDAYVDIAISRLDERLSN
jgi:Spy/CpxP family protein refolding chaperone